MNSIRQYAKNYQKKSKKQQVQESQAFSSFLPFSNYLGDNCVATEDGDFLAFYELFPADIPCLSTSDLTALISIWNTALLGLDSSFSLCLSLQRQPYKYENKVFAAHHLLERHYTSSNLKDLTALVHIEKVPEILLFYVQDKVWGQIFNGKNLHFETLYSLDIEYLFDKPDYIVYPLLDFLLASVVLSGAPTFIILDEAWFFLRNKFFAAKIVDWLKTARKKNAAVILAMPLEQEIDNAIINSCMTKIFMADPSADALKITYASYGLSETDIKILARIRPKRDAYFTSPEGRQVFQVSAAPTCLTFAQAHQDFIARITETKNKKGWQEAFL